MSLTEDIVKAICHKDSSSSTQSPYKRFISNPKKIGFMFFNSDIMLQKISKEKR